MQKNRGFHIQS